jgi:hypothetical protein
MTAPGTSDTSRLTEADRFLIAMARRLAGMSADEISRSAAVPDGTDPYAYAFGRVRPLLGQLADLAERLD